VRLRRLFGRKQHYCRAVIDATHCPPVTVRGLRNGVFSLARSSSVVVGRGMLVGAHRRRFAARVSRFDRHDLLGEKPFAIAAPARCWLRSAKRPDGRGVIWNARRRSPLSRAMDRRRIALSSADDEAPADGVSWISAERWERTLRLPITSGARLMLSTPPAIANEISPSGSRAAALPTASRPDAQSRLIVVPGTLSAQSESSSAMRATLRLSSPGLIGAAE